MEPMIMAMLALKGKEMLKAGDDFKRGMGETPVHGMPQVQPQVQQQGGVGGSMLPDALKMFMQRGGAVGG